MASGALKRQSQDAGADDLDRIEQGRVANFRDVGHIARCQIPGASQVARGDPKLFHLGCDFFRTAPINQFVTSQLFQEKAIERFISVERADLVDV